MYKIAKIFSILNIWDSSKKTLKNETQREIFQSRWGFIVMSDYNQSSSHLGD